MDPDAEGKFTTGTVEDRKDNDDKLSQGRESSFQWIFFGISSMQVRMQETETS
ncbi:hypothetical protein HMPREF9970_1336, partial [Lachnoanaerobaculum saburreum F0468]